MATAVNPAAEVPNLKVQHVLVYYKIRQLLRSNRIPPSLDEIAQASGVTLSLANYAVQRLLLLGYLSRTPGKSRSLQLTDKKPPKVQIN